MAISVLARWPPIRGPAGSVFSWPRTRFFQRGGAAGLYRQTTNPPTATGEGIGLAYRAGAEVMDMEFVQFHPTALYSKSGRSFLISEAVRGEGAHLLNAAGERFMLRYHELGELAPRDVVSLAVHREMKAAKSEWVSLSVEHLGSSFIRRRFPNIYEECMRQGLDITRQPIPVCPAAHYMVGGVRTDLHGRTSLKGVAACGEVAATGVHGANRLASNSLLECLVFAKRAVESASPRPRATGAWAAPEWVNTPPPEKGPAEFDRLASLLTDGVGLIRNQPGLCEARRELAALEKTTGEGSLGLRNRLTVAGLIAQAALLRTESRGVHTREDFPGENPEWRRHIVLQRGREPRFAEV